MQILAPLVIAFLLAGYLRDSETATTWTVAAHKLHTSLWPSLLRLDSAHKAGRVRGAIRIFAAAMPGLALLTAIAGIVTPLGLGEELRPTGHASPSFEYAPDPGAFLAGTSPRGIQDFSRLCHRGREALSFPISCPYNDDDVEFEQDDEGASVSFDNMKTDVADILREIFSSGTAGEATTVANFFDIEYRQQTSTVREDYNNNEPYGTGLYRQLESFILENKYILVEGLIIDAKIGGVGLRNHTIPKGMSQGATWEEDILFIEPDVACVNTNLTIDFTIKYNSTDLTRGATDLKLVDRGGFVDLNTTYPEYEEEDTQTNPDLYRRAMRGAFLNNAFTMLVYNVTNDRTHSENDEAFEYINSEKGKSFPLPPLPGDNYEALRMSGDFANYLDLASANSSSSKAPDYPNPFDITARDLDEIGLSCSGSGGDDEATMKNIYVACGLMRGAPVRTDGGAPSLMEHESTWSSPLHSCATALRATIKTVTFNYNATNSQGLGGLSVTSIKDKEYSSEEDMPLWGFEESGLTVRGIAPTWGLISPEYESRDNVSSLRAPHFHLPGYYGTLGQTLSSATLDNYPGSDFPSRAMNTVFNLDHEWPFDLLGSANMAIFTRWQDLSGDPERAAEIIRLMWTDLAASGIVGTKGVLGPVNNAESGEVAKIKVRPIERRITYNYLYGIPAFIVLLALFAFLALLFFSLCFGKSSFAKLRLRIQQLSPGRIFTSFLYSDSSNLTMRSSEWAHANGIKNVTVGTYADRSMKPMNPVTAPSPLVDQKQP